MTWNVRPKLSPDSSCVIRWYSALNPRLFTKLSVNKVTYTSVARNVYLSDITPVHIVWIGVDARSPTRNCRKKFRFYDNGRFINHFNQLQKTDKKNMHKHILEDMEYAPSEWISRMVCVLYKIYAWNTHFHLIPFAVPFFFNVKISCVKLYHHMASRRRPDMSYTGVIIVWVQLRV